MSSISRFNILLFAAAFVWLLETPVFAIMASASVDKNRITMDETVTLSIEILGDGAGSAEPKMPSISGFSTNSYGSSTRISLVNGRLSASRTYTYMLIPRTVGKLKIPSIHVYHDGEETSTQPISIEVVKSNVRASSSAARPRTKSARKQAAPPQAQQPAYEEAAEETQQPARQSTGRHPNSEPIILVANTDKTTAYVGEQVNLSITLYVSAPLADNPQYTPPVLKNFISEDLPPVRSGQREFGLHNDVYSFSEVKTALFALAPGKGEIQSATVVANIAHNTLLDPFDPNFIQNFMSGGAMGQVERKQFKNKPITVKIKPLPAGAPAGFDGAVGDFSMRSNLEEGSYKEGEPLSFTVTIFGNGNLRAVAPPKFPDLPDFKVFDTQVASTQTKKDDIVGGKKVFTYLLVPRSSGSKLIPALKFSYFDPKTEKYYSLETKPVFVDIAKSDKSEKNIYFNPTGIGEQLITATGTDIRYVSGNKDIGVLASLAGAIVSLPNIVHLIPVIVLAMLIALNKFNSYKEANSQLFKFKGAFDKAYKHIDEAEALLKIGQVSDTVSMLYDAFMDYLSDKCGEKVSALQLRKVLSVVKEHFPKVSEVELESIKNLWQELEMHHYAPGKADSLSADDLLQRCRISIKMLDDRLK